MSRIFVCNVNGSSKKSSNPPYPALSWLNYWERKHNFPLLPNKPYICPACGEHFYRDDFYGCHVQKSYDLFDRRWYIIPLCYRCNHRDDDFPINMDLLEDIED